MKRLGQAVVALILVMAFAFPALGQEDPETLGLMQTVSGAISDETPEMRWVFEAQAGDEISVLVRATSGDLDAFVQIIDASGRLVAENDDIAFPSRTDAALEQIEIPRDGTYTIRVTRYDFEQGDTSGYFLLTLLPGFADPLVSETFDGQGGWSTGGGALAEIEYVDGLLALEVMASNALVWASPDEAFSVPRKSYVQVDATIANDPDYWEYGLILRQTSPTSYYLFTISSRGDWAFLARAGASTWMQIQDWTEDPSLEAIGRQATIGVLADGDAFTFYVDGTVLGSLTADIHRAEGSLALSAGSVDRQDVLPIVQFDNLLVTAQLPEPAMTEEMESIPLESWDARDTTLIMQELSEQGLVPDGGVQVMLVPSSFTTVSKAGMQALPLGQGRMQTDFVLGSTLLLESESSENGCGLQFRAASDEEYSMFFLDGAGGYGLSKWNGSEFDPTYYATKHAGSGTVSDDKVLIVAQGDLVHVYVNGQLATARSNEALNGGVGIMALSFDGTFTSCRFGNTWLWTWN